MIDSIVIRHIDQSMSSKGARTLGVRVSSSESFETPVRPISTAELTAKSFLGYRGEISAPISALPIDLRTGNLYQRFLENNGTVNEARRKLQSMTDSTYMYPCFPILQLPPLDPNFSKPFKIAFDMQCSVEDMDYIMIPATESGTDTFEHMVTDWCSSAEDSYNKGAVPQIRMNEDPKIFSKKLDTLCELSKTGMITIVNVIYADPVTNSIQFAEMWNRRGDMQAIVNCSEVPAKGDQLFRGVNIDLEDYLMQHGIDSVTRKKHTVSPKYILLRNRSEPPDSLDGVDGFDMAVHESSVRVDGWLWRTTEHPIFCECSVCRGDPRDRLIERFAHKDNGDIEPSGLRYYSKLHDHQSDQNELENMKKYIRSDDMAEYERVTDSNRKELLDRLGR